MPTCPRCHDQYTDGTTQCATCQIPLVPDDAPMPPQVDRVLGTFHVAVADLVVGMLARRGIAHEALPAGEDRVEVIVDRDFRDDLRAELAINWNGIVTSLDREVLVEVLRVGAPQPGWFDAPEAAWVDRQGRLQVDPGGDEDALEDAGRLWGPTLLVIGIVVGLFGWYGQGSGSLLVLGVAMAALGVFLPR